MDRFVSVVLNTCLGLIPLIGILWIFSVPNYFGWAPVSQQTVAIILGLAAAAAFLKYPYFERAGLLELFLGVVVFSMWAWMAWNFEDWIVQMADRTPDMWVPSIFAIGLMMEALRKAAGRVIAVLVWVIIAYAYFGDHLPGALEAEVFPPTKTVLFLYADNNGVPGIVLRVITELVLAFIILGKLMEVSGGSQFFNDLALGAMGHRRGGPAKVAVLASSAFGTISGSTVGNIMSTGIVTIPLMKQAGFKPQHAGAIEAVASNGGQIAPPVMGATAFIIAEFLEVDYQEVVVAAAIPAILYFLVLFMQVDAIAVRFGIKGLPKSSLPVVRQVLKSGWIFILPLAVLIYFLFGLGYNPGLSALYASAFLLVLMIVRNRRPPTLDQWKDFFFGGGENLMPLILIGGGAGVIIGVMNSSGLGFQLSLILTEIGEANGTLVMLLLTAVICIILGMGMPTAAVYIVLVSVIAPALIKMGLIPMGAHLFIFYFGLLSMLTPPVAVASMVAAELAGSDMWRTGFIGVQLAVAAYLMPFLWAFNPALILEGSTIAIIYVLATTIAAGLVIAKSVVAYGTGGPFGMFRSLALFATALVIGSATLWLGPENPLTLLPAAIGFGLFFVIKNRTSAAVQVSPAE